MVGCCDSEQEVEEMRVKARGEGLRKSVDEVDKVCA